MQAGIPRLLIDSEKRRLFPDASYATAGVTAELGLVAGANAVEEREVALRPEIGVGPRERFKAPLVVEQGDFAVDPVGERNPVGIFLGGGEGEPCQRKKAGIEVDPPPALQTVALLDCICFLLDGRQALRIDQSIKREEEPRYRCTHFLVIVVREGEGKRLAAIVRRSPARGERSDKLRFQPGARGEDSDHEFLRCESCCAPHWRVFRCVLADFTL
jgi:hypothetical protein